MSSTCFEPRECFRYRTHTYTHKTAYTDASKTHYTIPANTTVFLKRNPWFRNM